MKQPQNDEKEIKAKTVLRRMGMTLTLLGTLVFSTGLASCWSGGGQGLGVRLVLHLAFGLALFLTGFNTWRNARKSD